MPPESLWHNQENALYYAQFSHSHSLYEAAADHLIALVPPDIEPAYILDLCCGTGVSTRKIAAAFPSAQIAGIDFSATQIAVARAEDQDLSDRIR